MELLGILNIKVFVDDCNVFNRKSNVSSKTFDFNFGILGDNQKNNDETQKKVFEERQLEQEKKKIKSLNEIQKICDKNIGG